MNRRYGHARLCLSALFLFSLAGPARAAEQRQPLIQLQGNEFNCARSEPIPFGGITCVEGTFRERTVSIFRNARAIATQTEGAFDKDLPFGSAPALSTVRDGILTGGQLQQLNAFLGEIRIANRTGRCNPFDVTPGLAGPPAAARYAIFWYSPDGRRSTVVFGTDFARRCPPEILELFNTVVGFGESIR